MYAALLMGHVEHLAHLSPLLGGLREDGVRLLGHLPPARCKRYVLLVQPRVTPLLLGLEPGGLAPLRLLLRPAQGLLRLTGVTPQWRWASHLPGGRWRARALPRLPSLLTLFV